MAPFSCIVVGNESLTIQCAELLRSRGHTIAAIVSRNSDVRAWAASADLRIVTPGAGLADRLGPLTVDWLFSIANLSLLPDAVLAKAARGAINFHDGPLPRYAGLNAPVWAILNRERRHGVTWHLIEGGVDEGDVLEQREFDIDPGETALTLNTKCYGAAIDSFSTLLASIELGSLRRMPQDLTERSYFGRDARPEAAARLDFHQPPEDLVALVRALDFGRYWNPIARPKLDVGDRKLLVGEAALTDNPAGAAPGTVLEVSDDRLVVSAGKGAVALGRLTDMIGVPVRPASILQIGSVLPVLTPPDSQALTSSIASTVPGEPYWRRRLRELAPVVLPQTVAPAGDLAAMRSVALPIPAGLAGERLLAAVAAWAARLSGAVMADVAFRDRRIGADASGCTSDWVPVRFHAEGDFGPAATAFGADLALARNHGPFAADLVARDPSIPPVAVPAVALSLDVDGPVAGAAITVAISGSGHATLHADTERLGCSAETLVDSLSAVLKAVAGEAADDKAVDRLPLMTADARDRVIEAWNHTKTDFDARCMPEFFEAQAARTPDATAVVFEAEALTYAELDARANRVARVLRSMGVGPDVLVGLFMPRSLDMIVAALAIQKAGGAYVPLDPAYPADRVAHYLQDSAARIVLSRSDIADRLPAPQPQLLLIDTDPRIATAASGPVTAGVGPSNLAYVIYTSGSTGKPKGVMIEHRNVANFYAGMDARLGTDTGTWLAVTSLSFDISVLELFWTLARGFTVVLSGDESRTLVSSGRGAVSERPIDFSLFYWGNDGGGGRGKYELLVEGARFADSHGFAAVWTPERHFHAFGGPYPNPSVTGAAVAAVTKNLSVRAGSCVAPLHHTARIAEEWAVIDNLTNGRAAVAIASGWQPDDFVLRPENAPPANKAAMYEAIDQLRRLWRGEAVEFPTASGKPLAVVTQPRPVSAELPIWVTTAGNPDTWKEAGSLGANVLTHLLGQSIDEVADKILIYHDALRGAGHDPADHKVTLMLHTFVGADREVVREIAREPMKDYLRSAAALIKQYAWAFPAFKKPAGVTNPMQIDLATLSEEELDGVLDFAFRRYFEDSGLFGTVEDCVVRVEALKRIGVDEIACLIDYGIPTAQVLDALRPLAKVLARANAPTTVAEDDFSIAAQIVRHGVTHLQCTPSMARMLTMNDEARLALSRVRRLMVGGEPLPGTLVAELARCTGARIENMYGPTETTIWSSTEPATPNEAIVNIGTPIANTRLYVLDASLEPVPLGIPGELFVSGDGVARGYWQRADLTAERFLPDPFAAGGSRMYRTGDLVRRREDGRIDFLGRTDNQVKIRGHRIELGEIEAALEAIPGVRQAVVTAREDLPGDLRLVGYVLLARPRPEAELAAALRAELPDVMVPAHIIAVDAFPLTPNQKVDRRALPAPTRPVAHRLAEAASAPGSDTERRVAAIWSRILGVADIAPHDNFFALGGHSLLAMQAHRDIRKELDLPALGVTDIFRFPVLAALATHIDGGGRLKPADAGSAGRVLARADLMSRRREMHSGRRRLAE